MRDKYNNVKAWEDAKTIQEQSGFGFGEEGYVILGLCRDTEKV